MAEESYRVLDPLRRTELAKAPEGRRQQKRRGCGGGGGGVKRGFWAPSSTRVLVGSFWALGGESCGGVLKASRSQVYKTVREFGT